ncbi:MAG: glycosyltransferase family 39 protein [Phycisphaerales bacterium]|nr:glycosyltransferase family 39 protein [Phycisphaerales bacterium]
MTPWKNQHSEPRQIPAKAGAIWGERKILLGIVALAVVLRVAMAFVYPFEFPDSKDYDALARAIVEQRDYQVDGLYATRMPGYPIFIAAIYMVCGYSIKAVLIVQAFLGGAIVYLVHRLARRVVGAPDSLPLIAAALAAVDPLSIAFSASLLTETPFTLCLVGGIYLCVKLMDRPRLGWWVAISAIWAVAVELRASLYWCIVPLAVVLMVMARTWRDRLIHVAGLGIVLLILFVSLLPWERRNDGLFAPARVHFTTLEGISLYEAVYPGATGGPKQDVLVLPAEMEPLNEAQRNAEWSRRAWECVRNDPARVAALAVRKVARMWSPVLNAAEFQNVLLQIALAAWHIPLFVAAIVGLIGLVLPMRWKILLLVPMVYFSAIHAIFLGSVRYRVPLTPFLCIFAAAGIVRVIQYTNQRKRLWEV